MDELLRMENIEKSFPGVKALSGVNLLLKKGELNALVGENGAGKSTLMKILAGVHQKDAGKVFIEGQEIQELNPDISLKLGVSIVYQEFNLFKDLTVAENLFIKREKMNKSFKFIIDDKSQRERAIELLDSLNLKINPDEKVSNLSVAEQQMVEIAKSLLVNCKILVMDEPTAALTESETENLFRVIEELKEKGVGIIYISHRLEELERICDTVTILRDGNFIKTCAYKDITMKDMIASMVGRDMSNKFPTAKYGASNKKEVILEIKKVKKGKKLDIENINLYKNEILGFYGLMGSGRTELARILFGADKAEIVEFKIEGKDIKVRSTHDAMSQGIAYLTEDRKKEGLALGQSVEYNINLSNLEKISKFKVVNDKKARENAESYIKGLRIKTPSMNQLAKNLSGGNQQKIIIGKWLSRNPKILIFDEPTRGIDVGAKYEVYELMQRLVEGGIGVIMISSELPEIIGVSDRVIIFREGSVAGELEKKDYSEENILSYAIS
ncbi:MAG: sugar ABC transporter ATP-binding protein [Clostridium beijerinckii]|nr:sugar ABC transporter ATP-binding protein [Clostridium beijerinckii]